MKAGKIIGSLALAASLAAVAAPAAAQKTLKVVQHSDLKILDPVWSTAYTSATTAT